MRSLNPPKNYVKWRSAKLLHGGYLGGKEIPEHYIWRSMLTRCKNKHKNYEHVKVCKRWYSYTNFLKDMGVRPSCKHSLDRINPFKGYCKENCRWATWHDQANNKRSTLVYKNKGVVDTLPGWSHRLKISKELAWYRWKRLGSFDKNMEFVYKQKHEKTWKKAPPPILPKLNPHIRLFAKGSVIFNLTEWANRLGISIQNASYRWNAWGTFKKGEMWCELPKA